MAKNNGASRGSAPQDDARARMNAALDKAFSSGGLGRDAQNAYNRTRTLIGNGGSGIVAGGNTTTVSVRRGLGRDSNQPRPRRR